MANVNTEKGNTMNRKAATSLTLGIISIIFIPIVSDIGFIISLVGLILGYISLQELKSVHQVGKKAAIVGIICNSLGILIPFIGYIFFLSSNSIGF